MLPVKMIRFRDGGVKGDTVLPLKYCRIATSKSLNFVESFFERFEHHRNQKNREVLRKI